MRWADSALMSLQSLELRRDLSLLGSQLNRVLLVVAGVLGAVGLLTGVVMSGLVADLLRVAFFTAAFVVVVVVLIVRRQPSRGG